MVDGAHLISIREVLYSITFAAELQTILQIQAKDNPHHLQFQKGQMNIVLSQYIYLISYAFIYSSISPTLTSLPASMSLMVRDR